MWQDCRKPHEVQGGRPGKAGTDFHRQGAVRRRLPLCTHPVDGSAPAGFTPAGAEVGK